MTRSILPGAVGALLTVIGLSGAHASPGERATKVAEASSPIRPAAVIERDDEATCSRARRRLFIAGEGWVVRRITTCR